jgi:hypothetical protein
MAVFAGFRLDRTGVKRAFGQSANRFADVAHPATPLLRTIYTDLGRAVE